MTGDLFRWRSTAALIALLMGALGAVRLLPAALGVALGFVLHVANLFLLAEIARSLRPDQARARMLFALSAVGRLLLLAMALAMIHRVFGQQVLLGACGGLLLAQVNLHRPKL